MQKVEMLRTYNNEQIKKLTLEELQTKFLELQETAKDGNIIIQKLQYERDLNNQNKEKALGIIFQYGQIDGDHHKLWVIDQIVKCLTGENYHKWIYDYEHDEETGETYTWDKGIAP